MPELSPHSHQHIVYKLQRHITFFNILSDPVSRPSILEYMMTNPDPWALARTLGAHIHARLTGHSWLARPLACKAAALIRALEATLRRALLILAADIRIDSETLCRPAQNDVTVSTTSKPRKPEPTRPPAFQLVEPDPSPVLLRPLFPSQPLRRVSDGEAVTPPDVAVSAVPVAPLLARFERAMQVLDDKDIYARRLAKWQARQRMRQAGRTSHLRLAVMPIPKWFDPELRHDLMQMEISIWQRIEGIDSS